MDGQPENDGKITRRKFVSAAAQASVVAAGLLLTQEKEVMADEKTNEKMVSNDTLKLTPHTAVQGRTLKFDFPGLHIGVAEYAEGPTGCTVFYFPKGALGAIDIRGGSPGTLMPGDGYLDAICYAGGSLYGLEAATGVAAELFAARAYSSHWMDIALVRGAIIYDYPPRKNSVYPDKALGRAALKAAQTGVFPLGPHGAGISATVGKGFDFDLGEPGGQGGAFRQVGPTKIAVFSVVNALGGLVNREGKIVRGHLDHKTGQHLSVTEVLDRKLAASTPVKPSGNTTLTVVVTNQKMDARSLSQMAKQVHSSLARAIQPFHGLDDGDVLYALTTDEIENPTLSPSVLSVLASELAWDAILTCY